ncbi:MAG: hypothetical protein P1V35_15890, partial [Planctomycetota bacterium]|nr:hypothetical protein [Planctomycetota bacterium]
MFPNQTLNPVARRIAPTAASWAGWDLQLEGLSGAPWSTWKLQGLALQPKGGEQALQAVRFGELNLQLDAGFWLSPGISQVQEVWARGGEVHYVAQESQTTSNPEEDPAPLDLAEWPRLDLADCSLLLQRPGVDELHLRGLRLGLKNPARPGDARSLGWKVESATHREVGGSEQSYALDGLLTLLGTQLHIQELNLI